MPLPQNAEDFLEWMAVQKGFSPATVAAYRSDLEQFEEWLHREQHTLARPGELEKYHFQDFSAYLFHEGQARSSISRKLSALRSLYRYLMKMNRIDANPAKLVRNPKREIRHPVTLNVDQMFSLLDEAGAEAAGTEGAEKEKAVDRERAAHTRDLALAELLYGSGLRISEALNLDVDDIDPASSVVRVMGKGSKERIAPLSDTSVRALFLWLRVRALLRRSRIYSENQIRIGEVTLDYNTLEVRLPGETVVLPQKEFYLLYKLFSYPNRIFTRQELMDEIWGFDSETSPRTVDVHIKRLRERFEQFARTL